MFRVQYEPSGQVGCFPLTSPMRYPSQAQWLVYEPTGLTLTKTGNLRIKGKGKVHPCTGIDALYRPYGP